MNKEYLGDAVYAEWKEYDSGFVHLILTTEDGIRATNTIVLEPTVIIQLDRYLKRRREEVIKEKEEDEAQAGRDWEAGTYDGLEEA